MFLAVFVCLSVCLLARLLKNARTDFDEMLRVDRCRERTNLLTSEPDPDHPDARTGLLSPTSYNAEFNVVKITARRYSEPWF